MLECTAPSLLTILHKLSLVISIYFSCLFTPPPLRPILTPPPPHPTPPFCSKGLLCLSPLTQDPQLFCALCHLKLDGLASNFAMQNLTWQSLMDAVPDCDDKQAQVRSCC